MKPPGWIKLALTEYRVLLLDSRGNGRSGVVLPQTLVRRGDARSQADYLKHFRADAIVNDCELIRKQLAGPDERWSILGQSYGGFCAVHYLSAHPEGLREAFITGGLPPLTGTADDYYRQTYPVLAAKTKKYFDDPKRSLGLFEHEYVKPVTDSTWKEVHDTAMDCLRNFYSSALFQDLATDNKSDWLVIEDLEDFEFDGAKIYVKLDFARKKNGIIEIYDWKTGKNDSEAASVQIGAYAIYAMKKWNVPLEEIRAYLF